MSSSVKGVAPLFVWLFQLYGDLQPMNAEPLSSEALIGTLHSHLPEVTARLSPLTMQHWLATQDEILSQIGGMRPDLIGLSCPQGTYDLSMSLLHALSTRLSYRPHIVLGHALPTYLPHMYLESFPGAWIVRGWGEPAIVELARQLANHRLQLEDVPSLTYLDDTGVRRDNPIQWAETPVIPERVSPHRYFARVEASRGCHYNLCTFCSRPPIAPGQATWRRFDRASVLAQIKQLSAINQATFTFADEDFVGNDPEGALALAEELCAFPGLDFALSVRADNVIHPDDTSEKNILRKQVFRTLKRAGLTLVFIGAESFSPSQLHRYGKGSNPDDTIEAIKFLETLGMELELGLILFDPLVTLQELQENIASLQRSHFWHYAGQLFSFLRPQVGTAYVRLLEKRVMLGELHPDTMEYDAPYADARIIPIANACRLWNARFNRLYLALRNVNRSDLGAGRFSDFLAQYRSIQFEFLGHLTHQAMLSAPSQPLQVDTERWYESIYYLMDEIIAYSQQLDSLTVSEQSLLQTLKSERGNRLSSDLATFSRVC